MSARPSSVHVGHEVDRCRPDLRKLPNVGPAIAEMLIRLGVLELDDLRHRDPEALHRELCELDGERHDPCVEDTFASLVAYANGAPPRPWWEYTPRRKARDAARRSHPSHLH